MIVMMFSNNLQKLTPYLSIRCPIVLLQNGVYLADTLMELENEVYVIERDYLASGLNILGKTDKYLKLINDQQWVRLCDMHKPILSIMD